MNNLRNDNATTNDSLTLPIVRSLGGVKSVTLTLQDGQRIRRQAEGDDLLGLS